MKTRCLVAVFVLLAAFGFAWGYSFSLSGVSAGAEPSREALPAPEFAVPRPRVSAPYNGGEMRSVTLVVEGQKYSQNACIPAHVALFAARRGGFSRCFEDLSAGGATPRRILNWAAPSLGDGLTAFLARMETPPVSADVRLAPSAPEVTPHRDGYVFAPRDVLAAVAACLDGETPAPLRLTRAPAEITTEEMRRRTSRIAAFSTAYADQPNRVHNLRLACRALNATSLAPHAEFGFNAAVGARTAERGYLPAKIIADGAFVEGVGGGVCQVSTTLYNAAMLAGMTQVEVHQHSLSVHYVAPSRDAMVSAWSDMRFVNPYDYPVYLYARAVGGRLTVTVYGAPPEASIALGTTCLVTAPARNVDEAGNVLLSTEGYVLVSAGRDGVSSTLVRTVGMSTHVLRRNTYPEVDAVWRKAPPERPEKGDA